MDRVIEVKINGNHLSKDNNLAGVQGEANATYLRIEFDEGWDGYAKTIVWLDARGEKSVGRMLTADMLEDITESTRIYLAPIPGEAMTEWGEILFAIDGYINGKRHRSVYGKLNVKPGDAFATLEDVTPSQAEQLQAQIDGLMENIQEQAIIAHDAATAAGGHAQAAATSEGHALQAAADAQAAQSVVEAAKTAAENFAGQAESSAGEAGRRASAAATSEMNAANSAATASSGAETATTWAQYAETAAEYVAQARNDVRDLESSTAQNAAAAADSATAAQTAETNAKAAQKAAEDARDAASEIAGGDFASHVEVRQYAETAESNANKYTDQKIATIPTPDVSGQIGSHNTDTASHNDIRLLVEALTARLNALANCDGATLEQMAEVVEYIEDNRELIEQVTTGKVSVSDIVDNLTTNVANKPLSAAQGVALKALVDAAQRVASGAASGAEAAQAVANSAHDLVDGAVKKSGDVMTGGLDLTAIGFIDDRISGYIGPEGSSAKLQIIVVDKATGVDCMFEIMPGGLRFTDTDYIERTVIHTGNLAQYMGVAQASLEE